jgi:hypothetical protein
MPANTVGLADCRKESIQMVPVMDFDFNIFSSWIKTIMPEMCAIGYDNYGHNLPEPPLSKVQDLIKFKNGFEMGVYEKTLRKAWYE